MTKYIPRKYELLTDKAYTHSVRLPQYKRTIHHQCSDCYPSQMMVRSQSQKNWMMGDLVHLMLEILEWKRMIHLQMMKFSVDQNE